MFSGQESLIFFYGIFWAAMLSTLGRFRLFSTHQFFSISKQNKTYAIRRFIIGILIINVIPIFWFWLLYSLIATNSTNVFSIMASAFISISVFGFNRILHSFLLSDEYHRYFYPDDEWKGAHERWGERECNKFKHHFIPGIIYLLMFPAIIILLTFLIPDII